MAKKRRDDASKEFDRMHALAKRLVREIKDQTVDQAVITLLTAMVELRSQASARSINDMEAAFDSAIDAATGASRKTALTIVKKGE